MDAWNVNNMKKIFFLFSVSVFFFSCGNSDTSSVVEKKSSGQFLYEKNCTNCHGSDGKLRVFGAKDLSVSSLSKEQMMDVITNGKSTMTPFGNMLNKEEVSAVADYVQTLKK